MSSWTVLISYGCAKTTIVASSNYVMEITYGNMLLFYSVLWLEHVHVYPIQALEGGPSI